MPKRLSFTLAAVLTLSLTACGFALRGALPVSPALSVMHIEAADASSPLVQALAQRLRSQGIVLADHAEAARLIIDGESLKQVPLTIGGDARVREFGVELTVSYRVQSAQGDTMLAPQTLRLSSRYDFDEQAILAAEREQEWQAERLRARAVDQIVRSLASVAADR